eukprot:gb/GECH01014512.1/.p1 GENE.gb/GECH01014512.1/~~gb/GECH01014512.1/.p1  ORF type:complete len:225 (+),score=15.96 gb/GECH01014512.1/:1-675(+)
MTPPQQVNKPAEIFLFVPNLIGYARIILVLWSYIIAFKQPFLSATLYITSFLLDALDGYMARLLGQCSKLGAVLDMVTDRFATAGLLFILSHLYPYYTIPFIMLSVLDFVSHWIKMFSALVRGEDSHKNVSGENNPLLRIYYTNRTFMGVLCLGNELFYWFLYLAYYTTFTVQLSDLDVNVFLLAAGICFTPFAVKQIVNVVQMTNSAQEIVQLDYETEHSKSR